MYRSLTFLMPCHSLEDFPVHHRGQDADNLLASWTALWHPALIAAAGSAPVWARADNPPMELAQSLVAVPDVAVKVLPAGLLQRANSDGAIVLRSGTREELLATALEPIPTAAEIDGELAADFMALGYCFLQVQLLTRQMRYASNLDERHFRSMLVQAAMAAIGRDIGRAREQLGLCFDLLSQERDHYYSVDTYLLDLTLIASTTIGESLVLELSRDRPLNLLLSGEVLQQMGANEHAAATSLPLIRQRLEAAQATILGGEDREIPIPLVDLETALANLKRGLKQYSQVLNHRPRIFGRRRFGLSPLLPGLLTKLDFHAALHVTLDDGRFPQGSQFKTRWEGLDGSAIDALARVPLDASDAGVFLSLAAKLGESMDVDHVATLTFAHWPGQASRWYDELCRAARYTGALGKFLTLDSYINQTALAGRLDRFSADQYHSPYLKQAVIRKQSDPLSSVANFWQATIAQRATRALHTFAAIAGGELHAADAECSTSAISPEDSAVDLQAAGAAVAAAAQRLAAALNINQPGLLVVNPFSGSRRVPLQLPAGETLLSESEQLIRDAHDPQRVVAEVPGMGFTWIATKKASEPPTSSRKRRLLIAEQNVLRNEFFEARLHPETGALVSIRSPNSRPNLLSQQLAFRLPAHQSEEAPYTQMQARQITVTQASEMWGEIESAGVLLAPDGQEAATFVQRVRVWRGSRTLELNIHLEPRQEPRADPWNSYYACRFAWGDEMNSVARSYQETKQRIEEGSFEAPQFIEINNGQVPIAVLTGGLPYHRLTGFRMLDTILIVRGETQRDFRIGLAVGEPVSLQAANAWMAPGELVLKTGSAAEQSAAPAKPASGWFLHFGGRNIQVTRLSPLIEAGQLVGIRARLLECSGRAGRTPVWGPKPFHSARLVNFLGKSQGDCRIEDGKALIDLSACEWAELEARWA